MNRFLAVTAALEAGAGLSLVALPDVAVKVLLGDKISGSTVPLGRVAGIALLALGLACWLARRREASKLVTAMVLYNCSVAAVLAISGTSGVLLRPAVALHSAKGVWSIFMSRRRLS